MNKTVEESLQEAMTEIEEKDEHEEPKAEEKEVEANEPEAVEEQEEKRDRDETGKFVKAEKEPKVQEKQPKIEEIKTEEPKSQAPQSWSGAAKQKWSQIPPDLQAEISKRENDIHQMFTRHDGELRLGREMKDVITPYMPIITSEGGTPQTAVRDLLNTAYTLRVGSPAQKAALIQQVCKQFNVDLGHVQTQPPIDPHLKSLEDKITSIDQRINSQVSLQDQQELDRMQSEVNAFAADPKNIYFEQVRADMAPLLASKRANNLQEAYEMACWARPDIRAALLKKQSEEEAAKKKESLAKKKQAASSVTGSPSVKSPNSGSPKRTLEEDLAEAYDELHTGRV